VPILAFDLITPPFNSETYWAVVTRDASAGAGSAPACVANVQAAWQFLFHAAQTPAGLANLTTTFKLCSSLIPSEVEALAMLQMNAWDTMAMGNYPYPSNYLTGGGPLLAAWPVRTACSNLADATLVDDPWRLLRAFRQATDVFNNATQDVLCYTLPTDIWEDGIWDYQWCTEMLPEETYFSSDGVHDMFYPRSYNFTFIQDHCFSKFGITPRSDWIRIAYGGLHPGSSNIVFSNGGFDPWSSGGVLQNLSSSMPAIWIDEGAHHLDLFFSNAKDPASVTLARKTEMNFVDGWIQDFYSQRANALETDI